MKRELRESDFDDKFRTQRTTLANAVRQGFLEWDVRTNCLSHCQITTHLRKITMG
ncbi:Hypothetical protein PHPALM_16884 [Phytophthora palmivora]|uniref:Uncharacterized protein n=1 Tax=Phytophthora palmivora TaxID=4796 RepID=A0A2P4XNN7_9STRA|nr:Hypothetical protein PHPALM_16884 [Phytophthora palmivora]